MQIEIFRPKSPKPKPSTLNPKPSNINNLSLQHMGLRVQGAQVLQMSIKDPLGTQMRVVPKGAFKGLYEKDSYKKSFYNGLDKGSYKGPVS